MKQRLMVDQKTIGLFSVLLVMTEGPGHLKSLVFSSPYIEWR